MNKIYKFLSLAVLLSLATIARAHDLYFNGIYYNITSETDLTVEVTFRGDKYDSDYYEYKGAVTIPKTVTSYESETSYSVTSIGSDAFRGCYSLTSVTIPGSVTSIGECAFLGSSIDTINVPAGVATTAHSFYFFHMYEEGNYYTLHSVNLPASVTSIGQWAFYDTSLPNVNPGFVTPGALITIENEAFYGISASYVYLSDSVRSIGNGAFAGCPNLKYVRIPMNCTSIASDAFPAGTVLLVPFEYNTDALSDLTGVIVKVPEFYGGNG